MLDEIVKINILYDFYGELLPKKQREILKLYYEENLSLGEIAKDYDLTRQGIHETLKRAESKLVAYEEKLKLWQKHINCEKVLKNFEGQIKELNEKDGSAQEMYGLFKLCLREMEVFR